MNKLSLDEIILRFYEEYRDVWTPLNKGEEGCVQHANAVYNGRRTNVRSSLYTLVKILRPERVGETGSWIFHGSSIMGLAMDDCSIDGEVFTCDIIPGGYEMKYQEPWNHRVKPFYVYPHNSNYDSWKYTADIVYPDFQELDDNDIFIKNIYIWAKQLQHVELQKDIRVLDVFLIDGGHAESDAYWDFEYAKLLCKPGSIVLIDDLYDSRHAQLRTFWDKITYPKATFDLWNEDTSKPLCPIGLIQL